MFIKTYGYMEGAGGDGGQGGGSGGGSGSGTALERMNDGGQGGGSGDGGKGGDGGQGSGGSGGGQGDGGQGGDKGGQGGGDGGQSGGKWGDNWRQQIAEAITGKKEGDEFTKELQRLERFTDPGAVYKSYRGLETKLSSGEFKKPLPDNATADDIKKFREENGIPLDWKGYYDHMGDIKVGEEDRPIWDDFFENVLHPLNMKPEVAKKVLEWQAGLAQDRMEVQQEEDKEAAIKTDDELRAEWGKDYRTNVGLINNVLAKMPETIRDTIQHARMPDGSALFNNKDFLQYLVGMEREVNPHGARLSGGQEATMDNIVARKAELQKMMANRKSDYYVGPNAIALQQEYVRLLENEERLQSRSRK